MSLDRAPTEDEVVTSASELVEVFRSAERPRFEHRVGLEHEKFLYPVEDPPLPVPYEGPRGIGALLGLLEERGYAPFRDAPDAPPIALTVTSTRFPSSRAASSSCPERRRGPHGRSTRRTWPTPDF